MTEKTAEQPAGDAEERRSQETDVLASRNNEPGEGSDDQPRDEVLDPWRTALSAASHDLSTRRVGILKSVLVTDDPERDWPEVRAAERYRMQSYGTFAADSRHSPGNKAETYANPALIPQTWIVGDEATCTKGLVDLIRTFGITDIITWALPPGFHPERMNDSLERFVTNVAPRVRAEVDVE